MVVHYDLFAGIGGFSLALDSIYGKQNTKHIFIEWDEFCQEVLRKHWPNAEYHKDIRQFIANAKSGESRQQTEQERRQDFGRGCVVTGGFPCQPFSQAGRRRGTEDDRYLWPEMFESIRLVRPHWVIAENVAGLVTWNEGMVLEQVCADLEKEGYEVQPFIIPAVSVNAPHRRDRIWIVGHAKYYGCNGTENRESNNKRSNNYEKRTEELCQPKRTNSIWKNVTNAKSPRLQGQWEEPERNGAEHALDSGGSWSQNWLEVAARLCRVDDGIPRRLDRNPRLKALGNAIVPQVAKKIFEKINLLGCGLSIEEKTNEKSSP